VRELIRDLGAERTVIVSSHILPEIEAVCPRVLILSRGRLAADGTPDELVRTLGHASFVRLELIGGVPEEAVARLGDLPGVLSVEEQGGGLDIRCDSDLREAVGRLAARREWPVRELSWRRATLEELFARIALELDDAPTGEEAPA
jgi:ABC-2 type transport system ATP-binding protein